ncbi:MAG: hypothetical protein MHPSP_001149, partial [Paramarteilia canceri]
VKLEVFSSNEISINLDYPYESDGRVSRMNVKSVPQNIVYYPSRSSERTSKQDIRFGSRSRQYESVTPDYHQPIIQHGAGPTSFHNITTKYKNHPMRNISPNSHEMELIHMEQQPHQNFINKIAYGEKKFPTVKFSKSGQKVNE